MISQCRLKLPAMRSFPGSIGTCMAISKKEGTEERRPGSLQGSMDHYTNWLVVVSTEEAVKVLCTSVEQVQDKLTSERYRMPTVFHLFHQTIRTKVIAISIGIMQKYTVKQFQIYCISSVGVLLFTVSSPTLYCAPIFPFYAYMFYALVVKITGLCPNQILAGSFHTSTSTTSTSVDPKETVL